MVTFRETRMPHSGRHLLTRLWSTITILLILCFTTSQARTLSSSAPASSSVGSSPSREVIVSFKSSVSIELLIDICNELKSLSAAKCQQVFTSVIRGFAGMLDQEDQESLRSSHGSDIQSMEDNTQLHTAELVSKSSEMTLLSYSPPRLSTRGSLWTQDGPAWPLQRINRRRWSPGMSPPADYAFSALGSGVNAYIVDTGIRLSHREFASFPDGTGASRALPAMSVFGDDDANDCNGHGTHNAALLGGLTFGVAKNTTLWSVRAVDCDGTTSVVALLQGLDWVARNAQRPAVVNLSLRSTTGSSALADAATRLVTEFQLPVVVAAGNEGSQACGSSPGNATGVLTVGASTMQNAAWNLTNWGPCVRLYAPGANIVSADSASDTAVSLRSGTSMSCPMVAGVAAQFLEFQPDARAAEVALALKEHATTGAMSLATIAKVQDKGAEGLLLFNGGDLAF
ncbi:hypothetical protein ACKKBF_B35160 [Auxenochlorella protothecoides x Auxenochlorella symbiontica]|uniref:Peptidase S8/S53 domain-containing protein n=1 Tax=Auxenochlorella protothecoides TaxID=3075 RepID=A0A1D2A082_AUXPR